MRVEKIKVLIVGSDSTVKGGITSVINSFLNYKLENIDIELHPTYIEGKMINKCIFFVKSIIKYLVKLVNNDFHIAHIHMSYKGSFVRKLIVVKLSKVFNKKVILHLHGSEFEVFYNSSNKLVKKLIRYILEVSDCVIVLGEKWKKTVNKIAPDSKIVIFNNAVNIPECTVNWDNEKINILFLGVLIKRKGIYDLIETIKILDEKGIISERNLKFIIAGSGPEEICIKEMIHEYKLEHCVEMPGWVDKKLKNKLLKKSQIFILPSYNEGLPMAILEAMSYGIPIISTDVGSISEVVMNNFTGTLIKPGDYNYMAQAIINLIDENVWISQSKNCKLLVKNSFNENEYFKRIDELYKVINE